jgi:hypothetical protein
MILISFLKKINSLSSHVRCRRSFASCNNISIQLGQAPSIASCVDTPWHRSSDGPSDRSAPAVEAESRRRRAASTSMARMSRIRTSTIAQLRPSVHHAVFQGVARPPPAFPRQPPRSVHRDVPYDKVRNERAVLLHQHRPRWPRAPGLRRRSGPRSTVSRIRDQSACVSAFRR